MTDDVGHVREIDLAWRNVLSVWWLLVWRTVAGVLLFGVLAGAIYGTIAGFIAGWLGEPGSPASNRLVDMIVGVIAYLLWSMFVVRMALRKSPSMDGSGCRYDQ